MNRPRESSGQGSILTRLEEWAGFLLGRTKESMPGSENKVGYANSFFFFFLTMVRILSLVGEKPSNASSH